MPGNKQRRRRNRGGGAADQGEGLATAARFSQPGRSAKIPGQDYLRTHMPGVPQSLQLTCSYSTSTDSGALAANTYTEPQVFVMNGAFKPDNAGTGDSVTGYTKYMAFFSKCFVRAARIKVRYAIAGASGQGIPLQPLIFGVTVTTNNTTLGSIDKAIEAGLCDYALRNAHPDSGILTVGVDVAKFVNVPEILNNPDWYGNSSSNPAQLIFAHVWCQSLAALATQHVFFTVEIEMDCIFVDPIPFT